MDERTAAKQKIRKLLLKAADNRTPEHERSTARAIALKMMAKHKIDEMEIWGTTKVEDIPEDIQEDFMNDVLGKMDGFVSMLEKEQEKAFETIAKKAEEYVEANKESMKKKFGDWLDGIFKK